MKIENGTMLFEKQAKWAEYFEGVFNIEED